MDFFFLFYLYLDLKIGYIGIDMCAAEREEVGVCNNKVEASSAFTVVNGDFGQLTTRESLTVVSIDTTLKAVYTSIIQPDKNCTTGTPCLHGGTCHNAVPKGIICECGREYLGPECQSTTRTFKGNSYLWLNKLAAYQRSSISLQFMTDTANGLLLYQGPLYKGWWNLAFYNRQQAVWVLIAHVRVAACLGFKASPGAQPFKWKRVAYFYANQTHFP